MAEEEKNISLPLIILFVGLALTADLVKLVALLLIWLLGIGLIFLIPAQLFTTAIWGAFQVYLRFKGLRGAIAFVSGVLDELEIPLALTVGIIATIVVVNNPKLNAAQKLATGDK